MITTTALIVSAPFLIAMAMSGRKGEYRYFHNNNNNNNSYRYPGHSHGNSYNRYDNDYYAYQKRRVRGIGKVILCIFMLALITALGWNNEYSYTGTKRFASADPTYFNDPVPAVTSHLETTQNLPPDRYVPESKFLADRVVKPAIEYYIRLSILTNKNEVAAYCKGKAQKGYVVSILEKKSGTIIFLGPYKSRAAIEQINEAEGINGIVETFQ